MDRIVLVAAWIGMVAGLLAGALEGLRFADPEWLGGYGSWRRRMLRLAHISLIALPLINLASLFSISYLHATDSMTFGGMTVSMSLGLLLAAQATMPLVCVLSAFDRRFRHLFFVPVATLLSGAATLAYMARL